MLLESVQRDLFTEEALGLFKQETARLLAERRRTTDPEIATMKTRLAQVEQQIANMLAAIKDGFRSDTLRQDLEAAERERARLQERLNVDVKRLEKVTTFLPNVVERFRSMLADLATVTQPQVNKARGILRELVDCNN
ncbi:hypothetical protein [Candidatus Nitrospira bockiana]